MIIAALTVASFWLVACGDDQEDNVDDSETPQSQGITPTGTQFPPGTVALFDLDSRSATSLDLGTAALSASWVEDGESILILDGYTGKFIIMDLDGVVIREVADLRATTGYEPRPLITAQSVGDGESVAVTDQEQQHTTLVRASDGEEVVIREDYLGGGQFSSQGEWLAGTTLAVDADGQADFDSRVTAVFARDGECGDDRPYACVAWELDADASAYRGFAEQTWSHDGRHLLLRTQSICPDVATPEAAPCIADVIFEVYEWPSRELVWSKQGTDNGEVRWAGNGRLRVDRSALVALDGTESALPNVLAGCCVSFSPDGEFAVASNIPGEDCSLIDVQSGEVIASVPAGDGDTNDTGICQVVSWTADGKKAIATGVNIP